MSLAILMIKNSIWYIEINNDMYSSSSLGERMGKIFALFPIMYLSGGTCVALIIIGGSTMKLFFQILCGHSCSAKPLTNVEWYLVFTCAAVVLSQLPNLNSIAGVSLIGAATAIAYCTIMWLVSVTSGRLDGVSYDPVKENDNMAMIFSVLNALGIMAFAFRGHNLTLEIQVNFSPLFFWTEWSLFIRFWMIINYKKEPIWYPFPPLPLYPWVMTPFFIFVMIYIQ